MVDVGPGFRLSPELTIQRRTSPASLASQRMGPARTVGPTECRRNSNEVTTVRSLSARSRL